MRPEDLLEKGHAYEVNGSVYFDVSSFGNYGHLSGRSVAELASRCPRRASTRRSAIPADFALWKRAEPGHIMQLAQSRGDDGYPGWHLECSVMSQKYIGETLDIHGGGLENQFPHHECEIAQAENARTGKPFCALLAAQQHVHAQRPEDGQEPRQRDLAQGACSALTNPCSTAMAMYCSNRLLRAGRRPALHPDQPLSHSRWISRTSALEGRRKSGTYKLRDAGARADAGRDERPGQAAI